MKAQALTPKQAAAQAQAAAAARQQYRADVREQARSIAEHHAKEHGVPVRPASTHAKPAVAAASWWSSLLNDSDPVKSPHEHLLAVCLAATPGMTPGQVARESVALEEPEQLLLTTKLVTLLQSCVRRLEKTYLEHERQTAVWERQMQAREDALCTMAADNVRLRRDDTQRRYRSVGAKHAVPAEQRWLLERTALDATHATRWEYMHADEGETRLAERTDFVGGLGPADASMASSLSVGGLPRHGSRACGGFTAARASSAAPRRGTSALADGGGGGGLGGGRASPTSSASVVSLHLSRPDLGAAERGLPRLHAARARAAGRSGDTDAASVVALSAAGAAAGAPAASAQGSGSGVSAVKEAVPPAPDPAAEADWQTPLPAWKPPSRPSSSGSRTGAVERVVLGPPGAISGGARPGSASRSASSPDGPGSLLRDCSGGGGSCGDGGGGGLVGMSSAMRPSDDWQSPDRPGRGGGGRSALVAAEIDAAMQSRLAEELQAQQAQQQAARDGGSGGSGGGGGGGSPGPGVAAANDGATSARRLRAARQAVLESLAREAAEIEAELGSQVSTSSELVEIARRIAERPTFTPSGLRDISIPASTAMPAPKPEATKAFFARKTAQKLELPVDAGAVNDDDEETSGKIWPERREMAAEISK